MARRAYDGSGRGMESRGLSILPSALIGAAYVDAQMFWGEQTAQQHALESRTRGPSPARPESFNGGADSQLTSFCNSKGRSPQPAGGASKNQAPNRPQEPRIENVLCRLRAPWVVVMK